MAKRKKSVSAFGQYLVETIEQAGMFKSDFYAAVGINKPYFYEILAGSAPPQDTLEKMLAVIENVLGADEERRHTFYDLAAECRQEIPADIHRMIRTHPENWDAIRAALPALLTTQKET